MSLSKNATRKPAVDPLAPANLRDTVRPIASASGTPTLRRLIDNALKVTYAQRARKLGPDGIAALPVSALRDVPAGAKGIIGDLLHLPWDRVDMAIKTGAIEALLDWLACQRVDNAMPCSWVRRFLSAPIDYYAVHPSGRFRTEFGPVFFRGRLDGSARVLLVGQDPSTDEILAHRTLVGQAGQRTQLLLNKLGMQRSYLMLNTFIFGIHGSYDAAMHAISQEAVITNYRNSLFDHVVAGNAIEAIVTMGNAARDAVADWPGHAGRTVLHITHPTADDAYVLPSWNTQLPALHAAIAPDDATTVDLAPFTSMMLAAGAAIPRYDLPFGTPTWHGTGGTRSQRNGDAVIDWTSPE